MQQMEKIEPKKWFLATAKTQVTKQIASHSLAGLIYDATLK